MTKPKKTKETEKKMTPAEFAASIFPLPENVTSDAMTPEELAVAKAKADEVTARVEKAEAVEQERSKHVLRTIRDDSESRIPYGIPDAELREIARIEVSDHLGNPKFLHILRVNQYVSKRSGKIGWGFQLALLQPKATEGDITLPDGKREHYRIWQSPFSSRFSNKYDVGKSVAQVSLIFGQDFGAAASAYLSEHPALLEI